MKKTILTAALAMAVALGAGAKTADELRVYINPGHGSWTANDRPMTLVSHPEGHTRYNTDTLSFFESNTNLRKGFGLLERLVEYGLKFDRTKNQTGERHQIGAARDLSNNIVMSHVKCGPYNDDNGTPNQLGGNVPANQNYYNRNLSEIKSECMNNNFDMFISIHSNAATEGTTTNYPLYLYRGYDKPQTNDPMSYDMQLVSIEMCNVSWPYAYENPHMTWSAYSATNKNVRGDCNFYRGSTSAAIQTKIDNHTYTGYLGVLPQTVPGFLVEGYFHTYQPARHRAMNWDVDMVEGTAYAHGVADYFGLQKEKTGIVYGIVRDMHEKFSDKNYKPSPKTKDAYKPLNGVKVTLMKDGKAVATVTTDDYYNGAFVFNHVEPGTYTIETEHADYKAQAEPVTVVVKEATTSYPTIDLEAVNYEPPKVTYTNYPDPASENAGIKAADEYVFTAEYTDEPIAELAGKLVRRALVRDNKMYVVAIDKDFEYAAKLEGDAKPASTILVYDLNRKQVVANVSTKGMHGALLDASDIQLTAEGVLLASNMTKNQYSAEQIQAGDEGRGEFIIYKWENDANGVPTGDPQKLLGSTLAGRWYRTYPGKFCYSGTLEDGNIFLTQPSITAPNHMFRSSMISVVDGKVSGEADFLSPNSYGENEVGRNYTLVTSPLDKDRVFLVGENGDMREYAYNWGDNLPDYAKSAGVLKELKGNGQVGMFKYAGSNYMVAADNTDEGNMGVRLFCINDGIDNAKEISAVNTSLAALTEGNKTQTSAMGEVVAVRNAEEVLTDAYINLYVLRDGKVTKFTTKNVEQLAYRKEFAYGLKAAKAADAQYEVTYTLTGEAEAADVVLTDAQGVKATVAGTAVKGENKVTVSTEGLMTPISWSVDVRSKANPKAAQLKADANGLTVRGGVIPMTDPNYDSFGYVLVGHGANKGIDIYNPEGEKVQTRVFAGHAMFGGSANTNQSDPFRGDELRGEAVFATWGDKGYGAVRVNPLDMTQEPMTLFAGEKQGSGNFIYNGVSLGGGTAGITFRGEGENTTMLSFSEDHAGTANTVVEYKLGNGWQITEAPVELGFKNRMANTNVDLLAYGKGFFASQVREEGNNAVGTPGFIYVDENNQEVYNSGDPDAVAVNKIDACNSGVAISVDGKTMAVAEPTMVRVFNVTWNGSKPTLTPAYTFATPNVSWGTMRFDYAGNLHYYQREQGGYHVYALPSEGEVVSTPAKAEYAMEGTLGVDEIAVDGAEDAKVVYYNLNGVEVAADNMVPGIYIEKKGNKSRKVVVK